jgi:APA family basic amino acid/polyamine antiporter
MSKKLGFWSVFAIVTGSQIGSSVFMSPATLAPYGRYSLLGWLLSGIGAVCLAMVFSGLCNRFPKTGGPHAYAQAMFGKTNAFFTGWTYWVISWVSTAAVVIASISYLSPFIGNQSPYLYLFLEIALLIAITGLNLRGIHAAGQAEFILTVLKIIPLLILPCIAIWYFQAKHIVIAPHISSQPVSTNLAQVTLLTLWGFIGLETATTPAGSVENPSKTIPRAIILGTICTALLYIINSVSIMGVLPADILAQSKAPYVDVSRYLFGGHWHLLIALIASVVCIGTLNAWMLASGQIVLGLAEDKLMPQAFAKTNHHGAPGLGIITSCLGIIPLLCLTMNQNISHQITSIIDISVIAFLYVYLVCVLAFLKRLWVEKAGFLHWIYSIIALVFCSWTIYQTDIKTVLTSAIFTLSGLPLYFLWYRKKPVQSFNDLALDD